MPTLIAYTYAATISIDFPQNTMPIPKRQSNYVNVDQS